MELIPRPRTQHEDWDRKSLGGSDYFPCSQSRKMSIGILPQVEAQLPAPNTSSRLPSHKTPLQVHPEPTTSGYGLLKKSNPVNSKVVHVYAKQSVVLQSGNGLQQKFDGVAYGRSTQRGNTERVQEFTFATAHQVVEADKGQGQDSGCAPERRFGDNTGSLKQKLWEALTTVPSQVDNSSDSKPVEVDEPDLDHKENTAGKPKQSSDTIETDSQSPNVTTNVTTKRPVTRSLTRTKTTGARGNKSKHKIGNGGKLPSSVPNRQGNQEKNIFVFDEDEKEERRGSLNRPTNTSLTTKNEKMNTRIEPRRISFSGKRKLKNTRLGSESGEGKQEDYKTTTCSTSVVEKSRSNPSHNSRDNLLSESRTRKEELCNSSDSKEEFQKGDFSCPDLTKESSPPQNLPSGSSKKSSVPQSDTDSPALGIEKNTNSGFFNPPSHKSIQMEHDIQSPAPGKTKSISKGFYNLRTPQRSKRGFSGFNAEADSSEDINDLKKSPIKEPTPFMEEIGATHKSSQSSEDQEKESLEDEQIYKGCRRMEMRTAGFNNANESLVTIRTSKNLRGDRLRCLSPSQKGTVEMDELVQPSDENQEDGLMRAVSLLVMALERFKTRIHTQTSKKTSEILASLGEGIQLQFQSANAEIQKDVLKFTNHGKSKRKIFETRFQEQQEQLQSAHNKFKEEMAQHLQGCKRTLEDFEAFQLELKGDAKRQKVLHQKLIGQMEEAIETKLSEADRRITSMHEVAKKQMYQLRHIIAECLKDGVFC